MSPFFFVTLVSLLFTALPAFSAPLIIVRNPGPDSLIYTGEAYEKRELVCLRHKNRRRPGHLRRSRRLSWVSLEPKLKRKFRTVKRFRLELRRLQALCRASEGASTSSSGSFSSALPSRILIPGPGFTGPTEEPPPVGDGVALGYDAKAIARWDAIPYQTFRGELNVAVVAFHMNSIDRVEFSVDGGAWMAVREMTLNPQTGVVEYWATVRAEDFAPGPIEVRAVIFPRTSGIPRVLQGEIGDKIEDNGEYSLILSANPSNALPEQVRWVSPFGDDTSGNGGEALPFRTIRKAMLDVGARQGNADRALIYLTKGTHGWIGGAGSINVPTLQTHVVISGAPGTVRDEVIIVNTGIRLNTRFVKFQNLTITETLSNGWPTMVWIDNVVIHGSTKFDFIGFGPTTWWGGRWVTNSLFHTLSDAARGWHLVRGVTVRNISSDSFSSSPLVLNSSTDRTSAQGWEAAGYTQAPHPDVYTHVDGMENLILYNVVATNTEALGVGIGGVGSIKDVAFVNLLIETFHPSANQMSAPVNHLVMEQVTYTGSLLWRYQPDSTKFRARLDDTSVRNLVIRNSVFGSMSVGAWEEQARTVRIENNHFTVSTLWSGAPPSWFTGATTGDPMFTDALNHDYRPAANSPLRSRLTEIFVPFDVAGNALSISGSIGALQP